MRRARRVSRGGGEAILSDPRNCSDRGLISPSSRASQSGRAVVQREDKLSPRRLEKQPASRRRRHQTLPSDRLAYQPGQREWVGQKERRQLAKNSPKCFREAGELA